MLNRLVKYGTLCLFLSLATIINCQQTIISSTYYGTNDGLSHRDVQSVHLDSSGFLWIATKFGLNKFDGYNFKNYNKESHGLQSNEVYVVR